MFNPAGAEGPLESSAIPGATTLAEGGAQTILGPVPVVAVQPVKVPVSNPGFTQAKAALTPAKKVKEWRAKSLNFFKRYKVIRNPPFVFGTVLRTWFVLSVVLKKEFWFYKMVFTEPRAGASA